MKPIHLIFSLAILCLTLFTQCEKEPLSTLDQSQQLKLAEKNNADHLSQVAHPLPFASPTAAMGKGNGKGKGGGKGGGNSQNYTWEIILSGPTLSGNVHLTDKAPTRNQDGLIVADYTGGTWTMQGIHNLSPTNPPIADWAACFSAPSYTGSLEIRHATGKKKTDKAWVLFYFSDGSTDYTLYLYSTFVNNADWIPDEMGETVTVITREWRMAGPAPCGFSADYNQPLDGADLHTITIERIE